MPSRYLIGIDLGTTNSVVAYIDGAYIDTEQPSGSASSIQVFPIPQLVEHGEVRTLPGLPSFLYFPTEEELSAGSVSATWDEKPPMVTGVLAREQGALVPSRQVSSAKSWLSYSGVNRRANILPAQAEPPQPMISPLEASARYLMHMRDAWNGKFGTDPAARFEQQDIVLTVPASFDEEARELTVEAARRAGIQNLTLLEEPLAAFYAWIAANQDRQGIGWSASEGASLTEKKLSSSPQTNAGEVSDGDLILICDIGGGTSDFSIVRARVVDGDLQFERTAIGEHLLLGGDNLDLALARLVEDKIEARLVGTKLTLRQRYALRRTCSAAKEQLLSDPPLEGVPITVLGSGRSVIGQSLSVDLTRREVLEVLTLGFLPITTLDDFPAHGQRAGLRELGLPYASDPAITKHLAAFLKQAAAAMYGESGSHSSRKVPARRILRPDAVLFNGGFCAPAVTRERIVEAISSWFGDAQSWQPKVLASEAVESAVARGAAYYGRVRQGLGSRIRAGNARTYYIGLRSHEGLEGICVLPAGVDEGVTLPPLDREFSVLANRPVSFTLYSSRTRHERQGDVVRLKQAEVHRHAPLTTILRYGKKLRELELIVRLRTAFTELGTLEIWCESRDTPHRWRLQFELRGDANRAASDNETTFSNGDAEQAAQEQGNSAQSAKLRELNNRPLSSPGNSTFAAAIRSAVSLIEAVFGNSSEGDASSPDALIGEMEAALGAKRDSWPVHAVRRFSDALIEFAAGRKKSTRHEVRWLNLAGFCLRPGFGEARDEARVHTLRTIAAKLIFPEDLQCQVEMLVLLRRIAGGINASEQQALYRKYAAGVCLKKKGRVNRQLEYEAWRLAASLEHLSASTRVSLGRELLNRIAKEPADAIWLWSLGRLGGRIPLYGPLHSVVAKEIAAEWIIRLLEFSSELPGNGDAAGAHTTLSSAMVSSIVMMARRTDDPARDLDDAIRESAISRLSALSNAEQAVRLLSQYVEPERAEAIRSFGESLPPGIETVSSSNCLLSLPGLHSSGLSKRK